MKFIIGQFAALFIFFVIFTPLERAFALHKEQKIFREGWRTDVVHFLLNRFLTDAGTFVVIVLLAVFWHWIVNPEFQARVAAQPFIIQFLQAVLIGDLCGYFYHRLAHSSPTLWRFHAVHHSSAQMDWLAAARSHPVDQILAHAFPFVPLYALGFTKETFGSYLILMVFIAVLNHANVRFRFPFLRLLIVTPEYHHWHHSDDAQARNKNFSGQLPLLDWIFGTFYLPKNKTPQTYGISEPMPQGYLAQMKFPFVNSSPRK